jgi:peroxiredoxin/mono/diheme cytochrome c family protein
MRTARISVLAALGSSALLFGCTTDGQAPNALAAGGDVAAREAAQVAALPGTVDNFMLVDQNLESHELYRMADAKAIVIVTTMNGCPIARAMTPELKKLRDAYQAKGVEFLMLNSALQDGREQIAEEAKEFGLNIPVLMDTNQLVGESLGVTRTAEVYIINPKTWQVVYRGPLDDRIDYGGAQKAKVTPFAANALDAVISGSGSVQQASMNTKGCLIDFPERAKKAQHAKISYARDVAPILEQNCVGCHQPGSIGPFSMTSYEMVKGFSPMIREVLRTDRMPPYNADPHVNKFSDNRNLKPSEIKTLVHWIEAGAPRGDGPDPLAAVDRKAPEWPLGKPDLILDVPAYTIPATGVVDYQRPFIVNPLKEGRWIKASTVKVGARQGVHHILTGYMKDIPNGPAYETQWGSSVGGYAVGAESEIAPTNAGVYLPPGGAIGIQAHYTPFGKEAVDKSQIALYFYDKDETPDLVMRNSVIVDNTIVIPAGEARHKEVAYLKFPKDALLYSAFPHAHYRGYASDLWIEYPDGKKELLLALPKYDFNWQRHYTFAEPVKVPAGSRLIAHYTYDNSKRNPANPDPTKEIVWGDQSFEEMFYTQIRYRWVDETSKNAVNYDDQLNQTRMIGMLDDNLDGKVQKAELKGEFGKRIGQYFAMVDKNADGGIDSAEFAAVQSMLGRRRGGGSQNASMPTPAPNPGGR